LIEAIPVPTADAAFQGGGLLTHGVEDAVAIAQLPLLLADLIGRARDEEAAKHRDGIFVG
jgi:hypothetical protein